MSEIHCRRQLERRIDSDQRVNGSGTLQEFITPRVQQPVSQSSYLRGDDITQRTGAEPTHPAFDLHLFTGAVHPAIIKDVPFQQIAVWFRLRPAGLLIHPVSKVM